MFVTTRRAALAAGTLFAVTAAVDIPYTQPEVFTSALDYGLEAAFALSLAAGSAALWMLSRRVTGRVARAAWAVAGSGSGLVAVSAAATFASGRNVLGPVFALGLLLLVVGYATLAVLDLRRRVTPRFAGVALAASMVAMIVLGEGYGVAAWAAGWFAVAALLQPTAVRGQEALVRG